MYRSKPIFASHSAICRMGAPVPIYQLYQQPAKPQITSSDHDVVATGRLSSMSEVSQLQPIRMFPHSQPRTPLVWESRNA